MYTNNKKISLLYIGLSLIFIATGLERLWGTYAMCPTGIKFIFSTLIYLSFAFLLTRFPRKKTYELTRSGHILLIVLSLFIIIGLFQGLNYHNIIIGNKYVTLFLNETAWMILFPPLFAFLILKKYSWKFMYSLFFIYCIYSTICLVFGKDRVSTAIIPLIPIFFYYSKGIKRFWLLGALCGVLIAGMLGGARAFLVLFSFATISIFNYYFSFKKIFLKIFALFIILLPFGLITYSIYNQTSVFSFLSDYSSNEDLTVDSRTFLYTELTEDLINTDSWIFGKSVIGRYYSPYFSMANEGDYMWRSTNEVTILNFLLKEGIIYAAIYLIVFILAIQTGLTKGKNRFIKSIAIMLLGIYFNLFIGDIQGCNLYHLSYWLMIGTCFSKKWLNMTDNEIKAYFNTKSY